MVVTAAVTRSFLSARHHPPGARGQTGRCPNVLGIFVGIWDDESRTLALDPTLEETAVLLLVGAVALSEDLH